MAVPRRYAQAVRSYRVGLSDTTLRALEALVPLGARASFVDAAIRRALGARARQLGAGALPGEQLAAIAAALRDLGAELDRHAERWGPGP